MKITAPACLIIGATFADQAVAAPPIDLTSASSPFALKVFPDATWGLTNCQVTQGSSIVTCPGQPLYTPNTTPYQSVLIADDAGEDSLGHSIPYVGTIASSSTIGGTLYLTLQGTGTLLPSFSNQGAIANHLVGFEVASGGTGYHFGSMQTTSCASTLCTSTTDGHINPIGVPAVMSVVPSSVSVGANSGGINGACTLTSTTQIGIAGNVTEFPGTVVGNVFSFVGPIVQGGAITADSGTYSSGSYVEKLTGCGFPPATAPIATLKYAVTKEQVAYHTGAGSFTAGTGLYAGTPPCTVTGTLTTVSNDSGTMLSLRCYQSGDTFPGTVSYGTDNTAALQAAIGTVTSPAPGTMNAASAAGTPECFYIPSGGVITKPLNTPPAGTGQYVMQGYGCWLGDDHYTSRFYVVPNVAGDVLSWSNSNANQSLPALGNTQTFQNSGAATGFNQGGGSFRNLSIFGDRLSTGGSQNALGFYGSTTFFYMDNVVIDYMKGRAIWAGAPNTDTVPSGDFNESIIQNVRMEDDGNGPTVPTMEITANGTYDGSNTVTLSNIRLFQSFGPGLWIHNTGTAVAPGGARSFRLSDMFLEDSGISQTTAGGPLMELGDPASGHPTPGINVTNITGRNIQFSNPALGYAALQVTGDLPQDTVGIDIQGSIIALPNAPGGRGLQVETCGQCSFKFALNTTVDYNLVVGLTSATTGNTSPCTSSIVAGSGIIYDAIGGEASLTTCIDPAAAGLVQYPERQTLLTAQATTAPVNAIGNLGVNDTITTGGTISVTSSGVLPINPKYPLWTVIRNGPTAAFTDTWDTGANFVSALSPANYTGALYHARICNQTSFTETLVSPGSSVILAGATTVAGGTCVPFTATIAAGSTITITGG